MSLIETQEELEILTNSLRNSKIVALDTEFDRRNTYYPTLSTVQILVEDIPFIIDVRQPLDFTNLVKIFENPEILKIFHAASQDLMALENHFNAKVNNIFDTQIAACFLGLGSNPSLYDLCKNILGVTLSKNSQFSNWLQRPLSEKQVEYALSDVLYLKQLYEILREKLIKNNKLEFVLEEVKYIYPNLKETDYLWVRYTNNPKNLQEYIFLKKIAIWREKTAKSLNISPNIVLNDNCIAKYLKHKLYNDRDFLESFGIENTYNSTEVEEFNNIKRATSNLNLKSLIKQIIIFQAEKFNIPPQIIATKDEILVYILNPRNKLCKLSQGWRYNICGQILEKIIL